jgi:MoxR-like ATPase
MNKELALLPLARLNAALVALGIERVTDKAAAIPVLSDALDRGMITLDAIKASTAVATHVVATPVSDDFITLRSELRLGLDLLKSKVDADRANMTKDIAILAAELRDAPVEPVNVDEAVRDAVAAILAPFKASATPEVLAAVASSTPKGRIKAGALFDNCRYEADGETVDFSGLEVSVWGDADAPARLDDYVFDARYLHEALTAIGQKLPLNCWLAGERGTGKTEFVTQLAARLGRKLYRINFDEAIERLDFIGGNIVEEGSVVWKAGVLAQAMQHAGALILLDEISFARAQSIAVLQSICEPSVHRGVMINETGQRIPVHPSVAFFCADNTNGYGDSTGNFTGTRDQNSAFIDRFSYTFEFNYLPPADEANLIHKRTGLHLDAARVIVKFAGVAREKSKAGMLTQPPSLRQLFAWAAAVRDGIPVKSAFESAVVRKYPSDCSAELLAVFTATVDVAKFKLFLRK